ncbi:Tyrosine recombinase XerD [subsurface metagenome]
MSLNIDDFLDHLNRRGTLSPVSENTKKDYRSTLQQFQHFLNGRQPTPELAQEWIQQLLDKGRKPATVASHGFALRRYFSDYLQQRDIVILLPSAESPGIPDYLELDEIQKLLDTCQTPMETALVTILCDTGLRISEFLALTNEDIDRESGFIFAHREKTKKEGWIPISRQSLDALEKYLSWRHTKDKRLFPFEYYDAWHWLRKLSKRAGMGDRLHAHLFRHTAAALRRIAGQEITDIADLLGHKKLDTTRRYQAIKPVELKERLKPIFKDQDNG